MKSSRCFSKMGACHLTSRGLLTTLQPRPILAAVSSAWIRRTGTGVEVVLCKSEMSEEEDIAAVMGFSGFGKTCKGRSELHVILRWQ